MKRQEALSHYTEIFVEYLQDQFSAEKIATPLLELGINSFSAIEILIKIEAAFDIEFPDSLIAPELFTSPQTLFDGLIEVMKLKGELEDNGA